MEKYNEKEILLKEIISKIMSIDNLNNEREKLLKEIISIALDLDSSKSEKEKLKNDIISMALDNAAFKTALLTNPKEELKKHFNLSLPDSVEINVVEETPTKVYLIIPYNYENEDTNGSHHW